MDTLKTVPFSAALIMGVHASMWRDLLMFVGEEDKSLVGEEEKSLHRGLVSIASTQEELLALFSWKLKSQNENKAQKSTNT